MIKVEEITSGEVQIIHPTDYEIVEVKSERNGNFDYRSATYNYAKELERKIIPVVKDYKIVSICDETDKLKFLKNIVLVRDLKNKKLVVDSLTEKKISEEKIFVDTYIGEMPKNTTSKFKQICQEWCDSIQQYNVNELNNKGITTIKAVACYKINIPNILQVFDIIVPGSEFIFNTFKEIAKVITTMEYNVFLTMNKDERYSFINSYFKS